MKKTTLSTEEIKDMLHDLLSSGPVEATWIVNFFKREFSVDEWNLRPIANDMGITYIRRASTPKIMYWYLKPFRIRRWILSEFRPLSPVQRQWLIDGLYSRGYLKIDKEDSIIPGPQEWIDYGEYISWTEPGEQ